MEMTNKHNNSSERILRETDHETQIHNVSRVLTNDQINHRNTKHQSNHAHLLEKDNIKTYKHTSFRGNMNAEVTVKHLNISTHLIYTDSQNLRKTKMVSLHSPVVFKGASVNYTHSGNTFAISNNSFKIKYTFQHTKYFKQI